MMSPNAFHSAPLSVGVLGCSKHAAKLMLPAMKASRQVRVTAIASRTPDRAATFASQFDCEPMGDYAALLDRPDIDAVYLPLPSALHVEWGIRALKAGKHVLCEKPLTAYYEGARELVEIAQSQNRVLMESFMFLSHRQHRAVAEQVAEGSIGRLQHFSSSFGFPPLTAGDIRYRPDLGGGALLDAGVYPIKAAQLYLGPDLKVLGASRRMSARTRVDIAGSALLVSPDGVTASLSWGFDHQYRCEYGLWGSEGNLTLDRAYTPPTLFRPSLELVRGTERTAVERLFLNDAGWLNRGESLLAHTALVEQIAEIADVYWEGRD
jgi:dTDP-3,4-didehydro-2,6-dideoxy-alpha-D-glucose 3-reductase